MKLIDKVKNPTDYNFSHHTNVYNGCLMTSVIIKVEHLVGAGSSACHPEDVEFCSRKVGEHIAFLRAQIDILDKIIYEKQQRLYSIKDMMSSIEINIPHFDLDPTNRITEYIMRRERELEKFTNCRTQLKKELHIYLCSLDKNHKIVRQLRENKDKTKQLL